MSNFPDYSLPGIDPNMTPEQHHAQYLELLRERDARDAERERARARDERSARTAGEFHSLKLPAGPGQCGGALYCLPLGTDVVCVLSTGHDGEHRSRDLEGHPVTWPRTEHTTNEDTP